MIDLPGGIHCARCGSVSEGDDTNNPQMPCCWFHYDPGKDTMVQLRPDRPRIVQATPTSFLKYDYLCKSCCRGNLDKDDIIYPRTAPHLRVAAGL